MPPIIRAMFRGPNDYAHNDRVHVESDDECAFCKEPYATTASQEGCRAIRLYDCGHIVGYECFRTWLQRQPDTCLYYNHALPRGRKSVASLQDCIERFLEFICTTYWFLLVEDLTHNLMFDETLTTAADYMLRLESLEALVSDRLTWENAKTVFKMYAKGAGLFSTIFGVLLLVGFAALYVSLNILGALFWWTSWTELAFKAIGSGALSSFWGIMKTSGGVAPWLLVIGIAHTLLFLLVLVSVLGLGWRRSKRARAPLAVKDE